MKKNEIQKKIVNSMLNSKGNGIIAAATGVGKTKCGIDYLKKIEFKKALWVVPTEILRDVTVKNEFTKWRAKTIFKKVETQCYANLKNINGKEYDVVILDEGHNLTENNSKFFYRNKIGRAFILTATIPHEDEKIDIINDLNFRILYEIDLDFAVDNGLVSAYSVIVHEIPLDTSKNFKVEVKDKSWYTSESQQYDYLTRKIEDEKDLEGFANKFLYFNRMRFIQNLPSKTRFAQKIIEKIPDDKRCLIFCGSISQAETVCKNYYHSKSSKKHYNLFNEKKINKLAVVNALNEGHNMTDVTSAIMVQVNSNRRNYVQRQGRAIRWRKGHKSHIHIISSYETVDSRWVEKSLSAVDPKTIKYIRYKNKSL